MTPLQSGVRDVALMAMITGIFIAFTAVMFGRDNWWAASIGLVAFLFTGWITMALQARILHLYGEDV
jgi:ABC-type uncharacterized transport system permease subunit